MVDNQDLMRQISHAGAAMDPALTDRDVDRLVHGAARRRRQRKARRLLYAGTTVLAMAIALLVWGPHRQDVFHPQRPSLAVRPPATPPSRPSGFPRMLRLADGSTAMPLDPSTEMAIVEDTRDRVAITLTRGRGRFDVTPRPSRRFVVKMGDVSVSVLGTLFTLERVADRVGLAVEQGSVRIDWGMGFETLNEGDHGWYPPLVKSPRSGRTQVRRTARRPASTRPSPPPAPSHAEASPSPVGPVETVAPLEKTEARESAEQLLAAADSARIAGKPGEGIVWLRRLLRDHREDARAPLAAFTLGRILLIELARPREAADAFAEARRLSPTGPLSEDALAREAEAYSQAGATDLAKACAQEYLRLYPNGRRRAAVSRMAGTR